MYTRTVDGKTSFVASAGVFNISGIKFTGNPGNSYSNLYLIITLGLLFETDAIDNNKPAN